MDSRSVLNHKLDSRNYLTQLFGEQLPAIRNGFFNIHMSKGAIVQPHWHTNTTEMIFMISGEAVTAVFNPFTCKIMAYYLRPGQISVLPKGWYHWIIAETDCVHLLTIFDQPSPNVVLGADFLAAHLQRSMSGRIVPQPRTMLVLWHPSKNR